MYSGRALKHASGTVPRYLDAAACAAGEAHGDAACRAGTVAGVPRHIPRQQMGEVGFC